MIRALTLILALVFVAGGCSDDDTVQSPAAIIQTNETSGPTVEPTAATRATVTRGPTSEPSPNANALDWDVESCEEVADLIITRVQGFLNDAESMDISDLAGDDTPESLQSFEDDLDRIATISDDLGCDNDEIDELLRERLDGLQAEGPIATLLLAGIRESIEAGDMFPADES